MISTRECRHGRMSFLDTDRYVGRSLGWYGEWSEAEVELLAGFLRPGDTVLEVGAHVGAHALGLAAHLPEGQVIALEPQPALFALLQANAAANAPERVLPLCAAAGGAPGKAWLPPLDYAAPGNFGGVSLAERAAPGGTEVEVMRLDALPLSECRALKIDAEGMELEVLAGARQLIQRTGAVIYLENDRAQHAAGLIALLAELGYRLYWHLPPLFDPRNFAGATENIFGRLVSINMLALPAAVEAPAERLLARAELPWLLEHLGLPETAPLLVPVEAGDVELSAWIPRP